MTPDRTDQTHPDDAEHEQHGVLSETGSLDTSGIGILGGQTEQVSVELPSDSEDDSAMTTTWSTTRSRPIARRSHRRRRPDRDCRGEV